MKALCTLLVCLIAAPLCAQSDHADLARAAFEASALPAPPRSVASALPFITRLLSMLPAAEQAGYVKGPDGGENVAPLPDGTLVRISRVMYPNGQIYKVLSDAPNGNPQWVAEDVNPSLYVPLMGHSAPPPVVVVPPVGSGGTVPLPPGTGAGFDLDALQRQMRIENQLLIAQLKLDALQQQLKAHDESPSWLATVFGNRYVQLGLATLTTWVTTQQITKE